MFSLVSAMPLIVISDSGSDRSLYKLWLGSKFEIPFGSSLHSGYRADRMLAQPVIKGQTIRDM